MVIYRPMQLVSMLRVDTQKNEFRYDAERRNNLK